jgi:cysteine desulfurase/selenocysteine lyase
MVYLAYMFKSADIKKDFPLFKTYPDLVFVDNASTSQKPQVVIDAIIDYYTKSNANVHRAVYDLGIKSDEIYSSTRQNLKDFYGREEVVFTNGTTDGINKIARSLQSQLTKEHNIVVSEMEHHSNLVPWQELSKDLGLDLRIARITTSGELDMDHLYELVDGQTAVVSLVHISNTLGTKNDLATLGQYLKNHNTYFIVDAAQSCVFHREEIRKINADAFVFGSHKMFGPSGIGVILAKSTFLDQLDPFDFGGGMVTEVHPTYSEYRQDVTRFEGGTPPLAQVAGLNAAIKYLMDLDLNVCITHVSELAKELRRGLEELGAVCYGPKGKLNAGIVSATFGDIHPHDVASFLNSKNISVRAGHHCTQLIMKKYNISSSVRFSFSIYNEKKEVGQILKAVKEMQDYFR